MTLSEYRASRSTTPAPASKLGNKRTVYNGTEYDSKAEASYAAALDRLKAAGVVREWEAQVNYPLLVNGQKIATYRLDFRVHYADGHTEYVDVKGQRTGVPFSMFRMKQKLMRALFAIEVTLYPPEKTKTPKTKKR